VTLSEAHGETERSAEKPAGPLLRIENVTKRFGGFTAVDDLSLNIARGEFFALLGPSGCGKSTLLRLIAGFERPDSGRIILDDEDLADRPPHLRPVNMMFQSYALFPHLNVARNVAFGLKQDRMPRGEIRARVEEMFALLQIEELGGRKPHQLSGGQRQRVALARALVKRPKLLLLDEPMAALDKKLRGETQAQLAALQRQIGTTFIVVTHDQEEAMSLAGRMAVMERGRLVQVGTPADLYERPRSRAVAAFIGEINLLDGTIAGVGPDSVTIDCGPLGAFRARGGAPLSTGDAVTLALRPEKLRLNVSPPSPGLNAILGEIESVNYFGDRCVYGVRASDTLLRVNVANPELLGEGLRSGDPVWVSWQPASGVLLNR
jgi:putrescine transport system ATP-binding protein